MKRAAPSSVEEAMDSGTFLAPPALQQSNGSGVRGFVNGDKQSGTGMEGASFTQFNPQTRLQIDEPAMPAEHEREQELSDDSETLSPDAGKRLKKTKGRVKIKMEFIENKLRRYTTFSKRKTGIMKKAYELSTLTGTQVMLLVASETGHVYTFATRKLQPMITSESGKALIQTCLNSPDPATTHHNHNPADQRMSATGFEETELTYQVTEEELAKQEAKSPMFTVTNVPGAGVDVSSAGAASTQSGLSISGAGHTYPMTTYLPTGQSSVSTAGNNKPVLGMSTSEMLAQGSFATILPQGVLQLPQGQGTSQANTSIHPSHLLYRLQQPGSPLVLSPTITSATTPPPSSAGQTNTSASHQSSLASTSASTTSPLMYNTSQGIVYTTSPGSIPENLLLPSYQATTSGSQAQERSAMSVGLLPVSASQSTTSTTLAIPVTMAKSSLENSQAGDGKHLTTEVKGVTSNRQYLLPQMTKHR